MEAPCFRFAFVLLLYIERNEAAINTGILTITNYTDPYCTWCWGSEPILRHLQEVYGDQIRIKYVMGGLVRDMTSFHDQTNNISTMAQVAPHWLEASGRHGMPVDETIFLDPVNDFSSTYPASIAYKAAQFQSEELADRYLRRLREAASCEHRFIHRMDVQTELAAEVGLDDKKFRQAMTNGTAEEAFHDDLKDAGARGIHGFPTYIISGGGEAVTLNGYRPYENFVQVIDNLSGDTLETSKPADIFTFVKKWIRVATREVAETFELSIDQAYEAIYKLEREGLVKRLPRGNGELWEAV